MGLAEGQVLGTEETLYCPKLGTIADTQFPGTFQIPVATNLWIMKSVQCNQQLKKKKNTKDHKK